MPLGGNLNDTFPTDGLDIEGADTFQNHLASYPAASVSTLHRLLCTHEGVLSLFVGHVET
jgi:hypothetical protein